LLFLIFILISFASAAHSKELRIVGVELPGLFDKNESGPYKKLFKSIVDEAGIEVTLHIRSLARAFKEYDEGLYDGIYPATTDIVKIPSIESKPVNRVKVFLYSAPGTPPIQSIAQLKGLKVGRVRGMDYPKAIMMAPVKVALTGNEGQSIRMLLKGRTKAFFGTVPDVYLAIDEMERTMEGKVKLSVDKSIFYMNNKDAFVLMDNKENSGIMGKINKSIKALSAKGKIKEILGIAYVD